MYTSLPHHSARRLLLHLISISWWSSELSLTLCDARYHNYCADRSVYSARTTSIPSLQELTALFGILPEMPLPPSRKRGIPASTKQPGDSQPTDVRPTTPKTISREESPVNMTPSQPKPSWSSALWTIFLRLLSFLPAFRTVPPPQRTKPTFAPPRPNPFPALKTGKKTIVIAAVDGGSISFFRFGQGVFEEWPMI